MAGLVVVLSACGGGPPEAAAPGEFEVRTHRVTYHVECTRCVVRYTQADGSVANAGEQSRTWRHDERIPETIESAGLNVQPAGEGDRITSVVISVDGFPRADAFLPATGSSEPVLVSVLLERR